MISSQQAVVDQLHDIYGMVHIPFWQTRSFFITVVILVMVLFGCIIWYLIKVWRKWRHNKTPWDRALDQLKNLEKRGLVNEAFSKIFYHELTNIIKRYMHDRFGDDLLSKTDEEIIVYSGSINVGDDSMRSIKEIFNGVADIKFAQTIVSQERMQRDLIAAKKLIKETVPHKK